MRVDSSDYTPSKTASPDAKANDTSASTYDGYIARARYGRRFK